MKKCVLFLVMAAFVAVTEKLPAQGTAFTYQGQLQNGGGAANGPYDFTFSLFNNNSTNTGQVGSTLTNLEVGVTNGLFTVTLDFGSVFTGNDTWLAIGVRTSGGTNFTALSPLQELTPAPYAIYAPTAGTAAFANSVAGSNIVGTIAAGQLPSNVISASVQASNIQSLNAVLGDTNAAAIASLTVAPVLPSSAVGSLSTGFSSIAVAGRYLYGVANLNGYALAVVDVSSPASPKIVGSATLPSSGPLAIAGRYAYVGTASGLQIFDISDPAGPSSAGSISIPDSPTSVAVSGRYAYVGADTYAENGVFLVYDVSKPGSPALISSNATTTTPNAVAVSGRYACVAQGGLDSGATQIFDISSPAAPTAVGSVYTYNALCTAVSGSYAYVGSGNTFQVLSLTNPATPTVVGQITLAFYETCLAAAGRYVVIGNQTSNFLAVIDVSTPSSPVLLGTIPTASGPTALALSGRYVYAATLDGLQIFDLGGAYVQSLEAGAVETGTLQTRDSATIGNRLNVVGGLNAGGSALISGGLSVSGVGVASSNYAIFANGVVAGVGAYVNASDARYKTNITGLTHALDKVMAMRGVQYDWRRSAFPQVNFDDGKQVGFIAQELKNVLPEAVTQDPQGYYGIAYSKVIPVLVEAIKDQQKEKDSLTQRLNELEAAVKTLTSKK
jgi:hypothetical protein